MHKIWWEREAGDLLSGDLEFLPMPLVPVARQGDCVRCGKLRVRHRSHDRGLRRSAGFRWAKIKRASLDLLKKAQKL